MIEESDKWVRVMADHSSDGFWQRDGVMMSDTDLPISAALLERHRAWCVWFDNQDESFDVAGFSAEGLALAKAIKIELPDWTVLYFDESKIDLKRDQPREEFEYEINA